MIDKSEDSLYPVKFTITDEEVTFPKTKVISILKELGYQSITALRRPSLIELRKGSNRAYLTDKELFFSETLTTKRRDSLHAQLFELLVTRIRILNQAAIQNAEAAKINLLQNQRRSSVSDAYYATFTAVGSLIEYIKDTYLDEMFQSIDETALDNDPEDGRLHFTPDDAQKINTRFSEIILALSEKQFVLKNDTFQFASTELSRKNSFVWVIISSFVLYNHLLLQPDEEIEINEIEKVINLDDIVHEDRNEELSHKKESDFKPSNLALQYDNLLTQLIDFISIIDIDTFAIGVSGREKFEQHFSKNFKFFREIALKSTSEKKFDFEKTSAILICYLLYAYALRQMADYEASFDSRIGIKIISSLCHFTDHFTKIIEAFTNKNFDLQLGLKIQKVNSTCSIEVISGYQMYSNLEKSIYHIGGVAANMKLDILRTTKILLNNTAYAPALINGKVFTPQDGHLIIMERKLPLTQIDLRIIISEFGTVWIEVVPKPSPFQRKSPPKINPYAVERFIIEYVLGLEILPAIGNVGVLYLGRIAAKEDIEARTLIKYLNALSDSAFPLLKKIHASLARKIKELPETIKESIAVQPIWLEESADLEDIEIVALRMHSYTEKDNMLLIIYHFIPLSSAQIDQAKIRIRDFFALKELKIQLDLIFLSVDILNELVSGDELEFNQRIDVLVQSICTELCSSRVNNSAEESLLGSAE